MKKKLTESQQAVLLAIILALIGIVFAWIFYLVFN